VAAAARQGQEIGVSTTQAQHTSDTVHHSVPRQQTADLLDQQERQNPHVATASHQLPPNMFSSRFLEDNREHLGVVGSC